MKELLSTAVVVAIVAAFIIGFSNGNRVTDYYRVCNDPQALSEYSNAPSLPPDPSAMLLAESKAISDCTAWNDLTADTYVVDQNTQTVVDQLSLTKLTDCTVADTDNWSCYDGGIGFTNGKYFIQNGDLLPTEHFGEFTYWWYVILAHLGMS